MAHDRDKTKRWQVSLRTVLLAVAVIGVGLGAIVSFVHRLSGEFEVTIPTPW